MVIFFFFIIKLYFSLITSFYVPIHDQFYQELVRKKKIETKETKVYRKEKKGDILKHYTKLHFDPFIF